MLIIQLSFVESDQLKSKLGTNCLDRFLWCGPLRAVQFSLPFIPCMVGGGLKVYLPSFLTHRERDPNPHGLEPG